MRGEVSARTWGGSEMVCSYFLRRDNYTEVVVLCVNKNLSITLDFVEDVSLFFVKCTEVIVSYENENL